MNVKKEKENPIANILLNIVIPSFILIKLSGDNYLGPFYGLIVALSFPIIYGIYDFVKTKNVNFISILGFASILLTGVFGLFELDPQWIAIKEASVPLIIGIVIIVSINSPYPLVKKLLYNDKIIHVDEIDKILEDKGNVQSFEILLRKSSYWLAFSFLISAILNFVLAKIILQSPPGTSGYTEEIGRMTALSFPVIAVPCTILMVFILWNLINNIKKLTNMEFDQIFKTK